MKKLLIVAALVAVSTSGLVAQNVARNAGDLTTLGGWDFNNFAATTSTAPLNARYNQTFGATYFTGGTAPTPGVAKYGVAYFNNDATGLANGSTFSARQIAASNAPAYDLLSTVGLTSNNSLGDVATNPRSILLSSEANLDSGRATFKISSLGTIDPLPLPTTTQAFADLKVAYSARNQGTDFATISWSYSLDGSTFFDIAGTSRQINVSGADYIVYNADFAAINAIEGVSTVWLGLNYSENTAGASTFLDNVAIYGTALSAVTVAIPEPSTYAAILGAAVAGVTLLRRRKSVLAA